MSNGCKLNCGVDMVDIMHYNSRTAIGLRYYSSFFFGGFLFLYFKAIQRIKIMLNFMMPLLTHKSFSLVFDKKKLPS